MKKMLGQIVTATILSLALTNQSAFTMENPDSANDNNPKLTKNLRYIQKNLPKIDPKKIKRIVNFISDALKEKQKLNADIMLSNKVQAEIAASHETEKIKLQARVSEINAAISSLEKETNQTQEVRDKITLLTAEAKEIKEKLNKIELNEELCFCLALSFLRRA